MTNFNAQKICYCGKRNQRTLLTYFVGKGKYHFTADLLFCLLGFDQTSKSVDNFNIRKVAESKHVQQEVNCIEILTFYKVSEYSLS